MSDNKDNEDDFDFDFDDEDDFDPDLDDELGELDDLDGDFDDADDEFGTDFDDEEDFDASEPLESTKDKITAQKPKPAKSSTGSMLNKAIIGVAVLFAGAIGWTLLSGGDSNQSAQIIDPSTPPPALDFGDNNTADPDMLPDNRLDEGVSLPMPVPIAPAEEEIFEEPKTLASLDEDLAIDPPASQNNDPVGLPPMPAAESNVVVPEEIEENIDIASLEALKPKTPETSIMEEETPPPPMPVEEPRMPAPIPAPMPAAEHNTQQAGIAFEVPQNQDTEIANNIASNNQAIEKIGEDFSSKIETLNKKILETQTEMAVTSGKLERQADRQDKRLDTIEKSMGDIQKSLTRLESNLSNELKTLVKEAVSAAPQPATVPLRTPSSTKTTSTSAPSNAPVPTQEAASKTAPQQIIKPLIPKRKASYTTQSIAINPAPVQKVPTPTTTSGIKWVLRAASPGEAVVAMQGSNDLTSIKVGSTLPGIGTIQSISQQNGIWIVQGTTGRITR